MLFGIIHLIVKVHVAYWCHIIRCPTYVGVVQLLVVVLDGLTFLDLLVLIHHEILDGRLIELLIRASNRAEPVVYFEVRELGERLLVILRGTALGSASLESISDSDDPHIDEQAEVQDDLRDDHEGDGPADAHAGLKVRDLVGQAEKEAGDGKDAEFVEDLLEVRSPLCIGLDLEKVGELSYTVDQIE